ncbi:MAG: hypothetical protein CVU88_00090 [Firmicutes bacterium HGW-Firmicutes-13]|nr:MAG: hypothetical protein CVU88_00090 [Firmicutes bacterium HGW-Firmicutes-13]
MTRKPYRMVTGVGSFPFKKEDEALELIFKNMPLIPHWPQLPSIGNSEGFVEQYLYPLIKIEVLKYKKEGSPFFDTENLSFIENITEFYDLYLRAKEGEIEAADCFTMPHKYASGFYTFVNKLKKEGTGNAVFLKGQISGPVTVGLKLTNEKQLPSFYHQQLRDMLVKTLELQLEWQIKEMSQFGLPLIIFIDDPGICFFGQASYVGLSREDIKESLKELIEAAHNHQVLVGVHVCSGIDWSILTELDVDIINIDAVNYFDSLLVYTDSLKDFINRGGIVAWGVVPTDIRILSENKDTIFKRLSSCLENFIKKGLPEEALKKQLMVTPSCGTGVLSRELTEKIYALTGEIQLYL